MRRRARRGAAAAARSARHRGGDLGRARRLVAGRARRRAGRELRRGRPGAARARLPSLCGRDPAPLDAAGMARAGTESMAENTSDAVVAPLLWGAVAGVPGLLGYRAVNTLDAMVGYRSPRYRRFGWAAARLDDLANLVPARVAALLFAGLAPAVGGSPAAALAAWRRDAAAHPSPNAGPVEAAVAGALGRRRSAGGRCTRTASSSARGSARTAARPVDLRRAARLSRLVGCRAARRRRWPLPSVRHGLAARWPPTRAPATALANGGVRLRESSPGCTRSRPGSRSVAPCAESRAPGQRSAGASVSSSRPARGEGRRSAAGAPPRRCSSSSRTK